MALCGEMAQAVASAEVEQFGVAAGEQVMALELSSHFGSDEAAAWEQRYPACRAEREQDERRRGFIRKVRHGPQ